MRIAVDAMGGDFAPREIVAGALRAAEELPGIEKIFLVGQEAAVSRELAKCGPTPGNVEIFNATEVVGMDENPANAIRRKKDSSIGRAVDLVKRGQADAMMSAGNTGAVVVAATLKLRTLDGIDRPAIATVMPSPRRPFVLIDAGANTDCSSEQLAQFAIMGKAYAGQILGLENPLVGLMSVGTEDTKGNEITKEAFRLFDRAPLNFKGNIEGHDLFKGEIDVVVCDGFVGNVVLKTTESVGSAVGMWIKGEITATIIRKIGALLMRGALRHIRQVMDPSSYGGAPLLGVNGVCIISHGSSSARAVYHAIRVAGESLRHNLNMRIMSDLKKTFSPEQPTGRTA